MDTLLAVLIVIVIIFAVAGILVMSVIQVIHKIERAASSKAIQFVGDMAQELLSGDAADLSHDLMSNRQPRSISDLTSVYAPVIARDFPDLNVNQLISAAENKLCSALMAIQETSSQSMDSKDDVSESASTEDNISGADENGRHVFLGATPDFAAQIQRHLESLASDNREEYFQRVKIHRTGINSYIKNAGTCVITLQTAIEYLHYIKQNGMVVSGSEQTMEQARYNLSLIYVQDESRLASSETNAVGVTCPNCGAPVRGLGQKTCEYCGSSVHSIDIRIWRMNKFIQS